MILKLGRVFKEVRSQDRARKTKKKVIRDWAEEASGPEVPGPQPHWPAATTDHSCRPPRPGTLAPPPTDAGACAGLRSADGIAAFHDQRP